MQIKAALKKTFGFYVYVKAKAKVFPPFFLLLLWNSLRQSFFENTNLNQFKQPEECVAEWLTPRTPNLEDRGSRLARRVVSLDKEL